MMTEENIYYVNMGQLLRVILKRRLLIGFFLVFSLICAFFYINMIVPEYSVSTKILVTSGRKNIDPFKAELEPLRKSHPSTTQSEVMKSNVVLREVVKDLELHKRDNKYQFYPRVKKVIQPIIDRSLQSIQKMYTQIKGMILGVKPERKQADPVSEAITSLKDSIKVTQILDSDVFVLNVKDYDPQLIDVIANMVAGQYIIFDLQQQIASLSSVYGDKYPRTVQLRLAINDLREMIRNREFDRVMAFGMGTVKILEIASTPNKPVFPRNRLIYLLTLVFGLVGGISLTLFLNLVDNTLQNPWDVERVLNLSVIGSIPKCSGGNKVISDVQKKDDYVIAYENIAAQIHIAFRGGRGKVVQFSDFINSENSGIVAYNVSRIIAEDYQKKTLFINADFRSDAAESGLKVSSSEGLEDVLLGKVSADKAIVKRGEYFHVLMSGTSLRNPVIVVTSDEMRTFIDQVKKEHDLIVIHTAAYNYYQDAILLSSYVDDSILTLQEGGVKKEVAKRIVAMLLNKKISIQGIVFTERTHPIPNLIYQKI